jgi:superfamily II DNA/RNA helicase
MEGKDVLGIAQTGTGKTASFVLPMITRLERGRARARMPRTLILEPTRELAAQVEENFNKYGINHKLNVALLIGGVSFDEQDRKLQRGVDVLIATPGRLLDHFERGKLLLTGVEILVIDEADRMLDMGFIPDIERIVKMIPFHPPDPVLLGHHAAGDHAARRPVPARARARRGFARRLDGETVRRRSSACRRRTSRSAPRCAI